MGTPDEAKEERGAGGTEVKEVTGGREEGGAKEPRETTGEPEKEQEQPKKRQETNWSQLAKT